MKIFIILLVLVAIISLAIVIKKKFFSKTVEKKTNKSFINLTEDEKRKLREKADKNLDIDGFREKYKEYLGNRDDY